MFSSSVGVSQLTCLSVPYCLSGLLNTVADWLPSVVLLVSRNIVEALISSQGKLFTDLGNGLKCFSLYLKELC